VITNLENISFTVWMWFELHGGSRFYTPQRVTILVRWARETHTVNLYSFKLWHVSHYAVWFPIGHAVLSQPAHCPLTDEMW